MKKKLLIAASIITLLSITFALTAYSAQITSKTLTSSGRIITSINIGIYSNSAATQTLSNINWGNLTAGTSTTYTLYVKNTGTIKQVLNMATSNWSPTSAEQYITVTWDRNNATITANQVLKAIITLTVASETGNITTFSNSITITGTG